MPRAEQGYLCFLGELVAIGWSTKLGFISLDQRSSSIDVDPFYFPNGLQTLVIGRADNFVTVESPQQQVIHGLGINYMN